MTPSTPSPAERPSSDDDADALPPSGTHPGPAEPGENYRFQRHVAVYRHVAERLHGTVFDAGCGEGHGLPILRAAGARGVIGAEADPLTAEHARRRYAGDTVPEIDVIEADLADLPLVDDTLDGAVCLRVVGQLDDPARALAELVRVVHPGGPIAVSTPNRLTVDPIEDDREDPFPVREYGPEELVAVVERAGLVVTEVSGVHHAPDLAVRLRPHADEDPGATRAGPDGWKDDLRRLVHAVAATDFEVVPDGNGRPVATSLDLLVWGRVPA